MKTFLIFLALLLPATAQAGEPGASPCLAAAAQAETEAGVPSGLLAAIGRIESGRWNPASRQVEAWPWTANAAGTGRYFASQPEAVAGVQQAQTNGYLSVDVGCFQVNLMHHPSAFATLDEAFDPLLNARYAARFLVSLRASSGSWETAVAQYHSATPGLGEPYRQRVMLSWQGGGAAASPPPPTAPATLTLAAPRASRPMAAPTLTEAARPDPHVLVIRAVATAPAILRASGSDPHVIRIPTSAPRRRNG